MQYQHLRALLAPLAAPVYLLPGNHDDRDALRAAFPEHAYLRGSRRGYLHYAVDLDGLRLVVLDTSVTGAPHGELDAGRLADLEATLAARPATPTILAMHHPPFFPPSSSRWTTTACRRGGPGLADVLARHPRVDRIVCGHLHRSIVARFAGRPAMTSPSTAHALAFDLGAATPLAFTLEPAGFLVHAWSAGSGIASHLVHVDAYDGL